MKNKLLFIALTTLMVLSGCGETNQNSSDSAKSSTITSSDSSTVSNESSELSQESSEAENVPSTEETSTYESTFGYDPETDTFTQATDDLEYPRDNLAGVGFLTAATGPIGTISMDDLITFKVFYGRADECGYNERDDNGGKYYDKYEGCTFYMDETICFGYLDSRGYDHVQGKSITLNHVASFSLPDLMDKEYVSKKKQVKGVGTTVTLTHYIDITLDISEYKSYFYEAKGWWVAFDDPSYTQGQEVDMDLKLSYARILFNIRAFKDDAEVYAASDGLSTRPQYELEGEDFYLRYLSSY